jgi:hypothetical protein
VSVVSSALSALVAGFGTAVSAGVTVIDGPPWDPPTDSFLSVGHAGGTDESAVAVATPQRGMGVSQAENMQVANYLAVFIDEDATVAAARDQAVAEYAACQAWLQANHDLDGLVAAASMDGFSLAVVQFTASGTAVALQFTVAVSVL